MPFWQQMTCDCDLIPSEKKKNSAGIYKTTFSSLNTAQVIEESLCIVL